MVHRWAIKVLPLLAAIFRVRKRPVNSSWRLDETYIKVAGQWKYLYRAVDKFGDTVDILLTAKRDTTAARRFLERAIDLHDVPGKITIEKSGSNTAALIVSTKTPAWAGSCANASTSTTSWSRITGLSNESPTQCSASSPFGVRSSSSPVLSSCT
jgi:transposase-like protein